MKVGIIGLPQTGKTTLYNALTRSNVELARFGGTETHVGVIAVPDRRFDHAVRMCQPKKQTPASIEFTEGGARIGTDEQRAGAGAKFGTDFFAGVRNMDALLLVVRAFDDPAVPLPEGGLNPAREAQRILEELLLADLGVIEGRLERLEKARLQKRQSPGEAVEQQVLEKLKENLDALRPVRSVPLTEDEARSIRSYAFVSGKPLILVANVSEADIAEQANGRTGEQATQHPTPNTQHLTPNNGLAAFARENGLDLIALCAKVEAEVAQMEPEEEQEFLLALGIEESARNRLIRAAYAALGLISFFTVGEDEVRAWTITRGSNAVTAAGAIHSDLARGFIRAELIAWEEFEAVGGCWEEARAAGKMRLEGKEYIVKDGDILHVRFKV